MTKSAEWLDRIEFEPSPSDSELPKIISEPPLDAMLTGCLFYPSSGVDLRPIHTYGVQSAVYADYGVTQHEVQNSVKGGFRGLDLLGQVSLNIDDLVPEPHKPEFWQQEQHGRLESRLADPQRLEMQKEWWAKTPFASWYVFERRSADQRSGKKKRVSLLYCGAEAIATFQQLFVARELAPNYIAIVRPGTGFGGNWTDFRNEKGLLAESVKRVMKKDSPRFLISDVQDGYWPTLFPNHARQQNEERLKENTLYLTERNS